jgi:hypothetical protein
LGFEKSGLAAFRQIQVTTSPARAGLSVCPRTN